MNREAIKLMAGMVGALGVSALGSIAIARNLGPAGRGELALVAAICGFATVIGAMGMNVAFRALYPRGEARVPSVTRAALRNCILVVPLSMLAVAWLVADPLGAGLLVVFSAGVLTFASLGALVSLDVLKAQGRHATSGLADLVGACVGTALSLVLIWFDTVSVASALMCLALGFAVRSVAMFTRATRTEFATRADDVEVSQIARAGRSFAGFTLGQHVAIQSDVLIAGLFLGRDDLGIYGAAATLAMLARVPGIALGHVIGHKAALGDSTRKLRTEILAGTGVGLIVAVGLGLCSGPLIELLYGAEFAGAADVLIVLMLGQAALAAYPIVSRVLSGMGKPRIIAVTGWIGGLLLLGVMSITAPSFGAIGAAWGTAITYAMITGMMAFMYARNGAQ